MAWTRQLREDERRWERRNVDVPIRVLADSPTGTSVIQGRGTKMSAGGICLFALANLVIGARIEIEFMDSSRDKPIQVRGVVRNRVVYLYGVEFLK
jgi:PilZ domain